MNTLSLEYSTEPFASSIVAAVPHSTHTAYHAIATKEDLRGHPQQAVGKTAVVMGVPTRLLKRRMETAQGWVSLQPR